MSAQSLGYIAADLVGNTIGNQVAERLVEGVGRVEGGGNALGSSLAGGNSSGSSRTSQEQALAQARGNVMSFGSVYGNADGSSYLSNTPTSGMFDGLAVAQNTPVPVLLASNGGIVSDAMPSPDAEVLRRATNGFDPAFPHVGPREENGQMPQITVGAKALPVNGGFGQSVAYDQFGQPLNGPSNFDWGTQFGQIWGSNDSLGTKLGRTWDLANYTVPDAQQRIAQMRPQLSPGAAALENMLGSPMAAIGGGAAYLLGGSHVDAYNASRAMGAVDGMLAGVAGYQMPRAPQPGQATAASRIRTRSPETSGDVTLDGGASTSARLRYMGATPDKYSRTGQEVVERMRTEGLVAGEGPLLRGNPNNLQLVGPDGALRRIDSKVDMAHTVDAVTWWNNVGRFYGPKAPEVRQFMLNSDNYVLQPSSINRSDGARLGQTYQPPVVPDFTTLKR